MKDVQPLVIQGYDLPQIRHLRVPDLPLYAHQAIMLDKWDNHNAFLVTAKTGSGKTIASALPVILNRHRREDNAAIFVYPTNELIRDQQRSIVDLIERLDLKVRVLTPDTASVKVAGEDITVIRIDADILEQYRRVWGLRRKADVMERLLQADRPKLVLINPDILYLLYSLKFGTRAANVLGILQHYQTVVFDEFHLYTGIELAHIFSLIHVAREMRTFRRVALLSATLNQETRGLIDQILDKPLEVVMKTQILDSATVSSRPVAHEVSLFPVLTDSNDKISLIKDKVLALLPELRKLRKTRANDTDYVPAVVILNSVVDAITLEDLLRAAGLKEEEIVPIRGLSARSIRKLKAEQLLVIGTSAIEVGIDFQMDYLLFEAGDAASFMQRFGRLGRHQPGTAYLLGNDRECEAIKSLNSPTSRPGFEEQINALYPAANARAWFVSTEMGTFAALSQLFNIQQAVETNEKNKTNETDHMAGWWDRVFTAYGQKMGLTPKVKTVRRMYGNYKKKRPDYAWIGDYLANTRFRTSLPQVTVYDKAEERRRGKDAAEYDVEIKTLLARAVNLRSEGGRVEIEGYGDYHRVTVDKSFRDEENHDGTFRTMSDQEYTGKLMLLRDSKLTAGSHLMSIVGRNKKPLIFVFVPYEVVRDQLDWRLSWFFCGGYPAKFILAFDGDALLLKEIYRKQQAKRTGCRC